MSIAFLAHANVLARFAGFHQVVDHYVSPQIARAYRKMANHNDVAFGIYHSMGFSRFFPQHLPMLPPSIFLDTTRSRRLHNRAESLLHVHWRHLTRGRRRPSSPSHRHCLAIEIVKEKEAPYYHSFRHWQFVGVILTI